MARFLVPDKKFSLGELALSPITELVVVTKACMTLLHLRVNVVVYRHYSLEGLLVVSLLEKLAWYLLIS